MLNMTDKLKKKTKITSNFKNRSLKFRKMNFVRLLKLKILEGFSFRTALDELSYRVFFSRSCMKLRFNRDYKTHQGEILWPTIFA